MQVTHREEQLSKLGYHKVGEDERYADYEQEWKGQIFHLREPKWDWLMSIKASTMAEVESEFIERLAELSRGSGWVVAISANDWELLKTAYGGSPLMGRITERALFIRPSKEGRRVGEKGEISAGYRIEFQEGP